MRGHAHPTIASRWWLAAPSSTWLGAAVLVVAAGAACSSAGAAAPAAPAVEPQSTATAYIATTAAPTATDPRAATDYLVLAPRSYLPPLQPLLRHRESQGHVVHGWAVEDIYGRFTDGHPDARALYAAIRELWDVTDRGLKFVLLVGDVWRPGEELVERLPTVYLHKLRYNTHEHTVLHFRSRSLLHPPQSGFRGYPSDQPYAILEGGGQSAPTAPAAPTIASPLAVEPSYDDGHDHGHDHGPEPGGVDPSVEPEPEDCDTHTAGSAAALPMPPAQGHASLALGRLPAREPSEVAQFVSKVIAHETARVLGTWPRRLVVVAGPARYSRAVDAAIEATALTVLENDVPYDYDLRLIFAKPGSPYTYRFDQLGEKIVDEVNEGALLFAYVGHSSPAYFDSVPYRGQRYSIGSRRELERIHIAAGTPLFVSLSCSAGGFDLSSGWRSMAEAAVMNPHGAVASFAASRESHPYSNMLYGEALVSQFLRSRPATVGEGMLAVKREMREGSSVFGEFLTKVNTTELKEEHASLYNLFGDPATRLRYPQVAELSLPSRASKTVSAGSPIEVAIRSDVQHGTVLVTVETRRRVVRQPLVSPAALDKLPVDEAFEQMAENHKKALDKVLFATEHPIVDGAATVRLSAPLEPREYVIKAFVHGHGAPSTGMRSSLAAPPVAMGHLQMVVTAP